MNKLVIIIFILIINFTLGAQGSENYDDQYDYVVLEISAGITRIGDNVPFNPGNIEISTRCMFTRTLGARIGISHTSNIAEVNSINTAAVVNLNSLFKKDTSVKESKFTTLASIGVSYDGFNTDEDVVEVTTRESNVHVNARVDLLYQITDKISLMLSGGNTFGIKEYQTATGENNTISMTDINFGVAWTLAKKNKFKKDLNKKNTEQTLEELDSLNKISTRKVTKDSILVINRNEYKLSPLELRLREEKVKRDSLSGNNRTKDIDSTDSNEKIMNFGDNTFTTVYGDTVRRNKKTLKELKDYNNSSKKKSDEDVTHSNEEVSYEDIKKMAKNIMNPVYFKFDSDDIDIYSNRALSRVINYANTHKNKKIILHGHASADGAADYNLMLSRKRAESVRDILVSRGVDQSRIEIVAHGETTSANKKEYYSTERRVDIKFN